MVYYRAKGIKMSDLKEITKQIHDMAENLPLSRDMLLTGDFTQEEYQVFLANQYEAYKAIEDRGLIDQADVLRAPRIAQDMIEVGARRGQNLANSTHRLVEHIRTAIESQVWAHIYVRYMGDVNGGQLIRKAAKWPTTYLLFQDRVACRKWLAEHTLAKADREEAKVAFQMVVDIYTELYHMMRGK